MAHFKSLYPDKPKKTMQLKWYQTKVAEISKEEAKKYVDTPKDSLSHRWNVTESIKLLNEKRSANKQPVRYGDPSTGYVKLVTSLVEVSSSARRNTEALPNFNVETIPELGGGYGLFGLLDPQLRLKLEGMPYADDVLPMTYQFYEAQALLERVEMDEVNNTLLSDPGTIAETYLKRRLYNEINSFRASKSERSNDVMLSELAPMPSRNLQPLPSAPYAASIPSSSWDDLLSTWEFFCR